MCSTGEAGSSLSYAHMTYPDLLNFSMHEKNRTVTQRGKYYTLYKHACMRDSSTALGQAPRRVSLFGGVWQTLLPMYLERQRLDGRVSYCLPVSTTRRDAMMPLSPRIRSNGQGYT